jgi:plasmid stabilization system protein ParE
MKIRWTEKATACLESISDHIAEDNPEGALTTVTEIFGRIEQRFRLSQSWPNRARGRNARASAFSFAVLCRVLPARK